MNLTINSQPRRCEARPGDVLLDVVRGELGMTGAKPACRRGECGACTVLVGGRPMLSCVMLAACVDEPVETVEGVAEEAQAFRAALTERGGFQCAYCTPGIVLRAVALLRASLPETDAELRRLISGNLCRCTGYQGIVEALRIAAGSRTGTQ